MKIMSIREKIIDLEKFLDEKEKLALVFLVCDDPVKGRQILANKTASVLAAIFDWAERENDVKVEYIYERVKQAMQLIQNKVVWEQICTILNSNGKLQSWILPMRKALYEVCENMTVSELSFFLNSVKEDLGNDCMLYNVEDMELNFLLWLSKGFIFDNDVSKVIHHLSTIGKIAEADMLRTVMNSCDGSLQTDNDLFHLSQAQYSTHSSANTGEQYVMDVKNMGICLIINQRDFDPAAMRQRGVEFGETRLGTNNDRDVLKIAFKKFSYSVFVQENLNHLELERNIKDILKNNVLQIHSSFILCILSHGLEGGVYCVDAVPVQVKTIEKWITDCKYLWGKPKIMIIQSCQGKDPQIARSIENCGTYTANINTIETDGGGNVTMEVDGGNSCPKLPPKGDFLTFWSTVPEHTSFRDTSNGSYFIQTLASVLLKKGHKKHVLDLFTEVNREVSDRHIIRNGSNRCEVSMPMKSDSLRKVLWFPYSCEATAESTMLLLESKIFENLFNEYCGRKVARRMARAQIF